MPPKKTNEVSLDDLTDVTPDYSEEPIEDRLARLEAQFAKMGPAEMMISDEQLCYLAAFLAMILGASERFPQLTKTPHLLRTCLLDALRVARMSKYVYRGELGPEFIEAFEGLKKQDDLFKGKKRKNAEEAV